MNDDIVMEPPLYFADQNLHIWCAEFHPTQDILATTLINGHIEILQYSSDDVKCLVRITDCHKSSARHCCFNQTGTMLATGAEDKRLGFIDATGKIAHIIKKSHDNPVSRVHFANQHVLVSGDDEGIVKVWDLRSSDCIFQCHEQSEAITGIIFDETYSNVLTSCLDGSVAIYDLKQGNDSPNKLYALSDSCDEELHGLIAMRQGKYLLAPSSQNSILVYKRDNIASFIDRVQGQPGSVEAILKIDDNTFLSGCEDGFVRGMGFKPNKLLQVIGQHQEDDHFPIQSLAISHCKNIVASTSHDNSIKFYDVSYFVKSRSQVVVEVEGEQEQEQMWEEGREKESDVFEDDDSSDMQEQDSSDSDEKARQAKAKPKRGRTNLKARQTQMKKQSQRKFFKGL